MNSKPNLLLVFSLGLVFAMAACGLETTTTTTTTSLQWSKAIGGGAYDWGQGKSSSTSTSDGGVIMVGQGNSTDGDFLGQGFHGAGDLLVVKLKANGDFDSNFGGGDGVLQLGGVNEDYGTAVFQTADGGYIIAGSTSSTDGDFLGLTNNGNYDMLGIKLNADGSFDTSFGSNGVVSFGGNSEDIANSVVQSADGGYLFVGSTFSTGGGQFASQGYHGNGDLFAMKVTASGALDTSFAGDGIIVFGGFYTERAYKVIRAFSSGYLICGFMGSTDGDLVGQGWYGSFDIIVMKLTTDGTYDTSFASDGILVIGGTGDDRAIDVIRSGLGEYALLGHSASTTDIFSGQGAHGLVDVVVAKLTSNGTLNTSFSADGIALYGGSADDFPSSIALADDYGLILSGETSSAANGDFTGLPSLGGDDGFLMKLTAAGSLDSAFNSTGVVRIGGTSDEQAWGVSVAPDSGFYFYGDMQSTTITGTSISSHGIYDLFIVKTTKFGNFM